MGPAGSDLITYSKLLNENFKRSTILISVRKMLEERENYENNPVNSKCF